MGVGMQRTDNALRQGRVPTAAQQSYAGKNVLTAHFVCPKTENKYFTLFSLLLVLRYPLPGRLDWRKTTNSICERFRFSSAILIHPRIIFSA